MTACGGDDDSGDSASAGGTDGDVDTSVLGEENAATGTPVKIGLFTVEGGSAVSEPATGDSAVAAAEYANDHLGGLGGHPIEIVRCGDKADGASATACGNQFLEDGVAAVVAQPATADQILPIIQGAGIPWVGDSPTAPTEFAYPNAFFFGSGTLGHLAAQAVYAAEQGWDKITIVGVENPQLVATFDALGPVLFGGRGVTADLVTVPQGTADATSQVTAALQGDPDAISVLADATVCQAVLSAAATVGVPSRRSSTRRASRNRCSTPSERPGSTGRSCSPSRPTPATTSRPRSIRRSCRSTRRTSPSGVSARSAMRECST